MSVHASTTIRTAPSLPSTSAPVRSTGKRAKGGRQKLVGINGGNAVDAVPEAKPASRADEAALRAVKEWHVVRGEVALAYAAACSRAHESGRPDRGVVPTLGKRLGSLLSRLERTEAKLMQATPRTLAEIAEYVEIAEEILTEKRVDPHGPLGSGPALEILTQVRKAVLDLEDDGI